MLMCGCRRSKGGIWAYCSRHANARIEELEEERDAAYTRGYREGVTAYAWWKDGVQYVGTCGTTLAHALARKGDPLRCLRCGGPWPCHSGCVSGDPLAGEGDKADG